jgi:predicted hotdog family 3-hydroxylacyl-ACP dehydratase
MITGDRAWIAAHIPHQGDMCLLDAVRSWDEQRAHCTASSHRRADNPLRFGGRLGVICAIEYAAQTIAVHSVLIDALAHPDQQISRPPIGYLASARRVDCLVERLDDIKSDLDIEVERLSNDGVLVLYQFSLRSNAALLVSGRAAVVLDADALAAEKTR